MRILSRSGREPNPPIGAHRGSLVRRSVSTLALLLGIAAGSVSSVRAEGDAPAPERSGPAPVVIALGGPEAPVYALAACVATALAENAGLGAERLRMGELRAQATQAIAEGLPTLDAAGSWSRSRDPSFALDETFGGSAEDAPAPGGLDSLFSGFIPAPEEIPAQTFWRASLNATWEINPGRIWNAVGGANLRIEQQRAGEREAELALTEQVLRAYDRVLVSGEELAAIESELASRLEFLEITRRRFRLEMATPLDTLQAAVSLANLVPERRRAVQRLRDAGASLNVLLGREPDAALAVEGDLEVESTALDPAALQARIDHRPDLLRLEHETRILGKQRGVQKSGHRPYLSMNGSLGYVGRDLSSLTDRGHDFWSASVALTVPLFDGLLTRGQVKQTEAALARTRRELDESRRQARLEVESLLGELGAARENLRAAELNVTRAELVVAEMTRRYELGKAAYLDVLNARAERLEARTGAIQARSEVFVGTAALKRALGLDPSRPFSDHPGLAAEVSR